VLKKHFFIEHFCAMTKIIWHESGNTKAVFWPFSSPMFIAHSLCRQKWSMAEITLWGSPRVAFFCTAFSRRWSQQRHKEFWWQNCLLYGPQKFDIVDPSLGITCPIKHPSCRCRTEVHAVILYCDRKLFNQAWLSHLWSSRSGQSIKSSLNDDIVPE